MSDIKKQKDNTSLRSTGAVTDEAEKSLRFTEYEHSLGFWEAMRLYWPAVMWSIYINLVCPASTLPGSSPD